jgi:hypothetical protein
MAYGVVHRFAGGTEDQYRASIAAVHPSDGSLPDGQMLHVAGATDDGWIIVAVHDSQDSWEQFRDGILMPGMQEGIDGGSNHHPRRPHSRSASTTPPDSSEPALDLREDRGPAQSA